MTIEAIGGLVEGEAGLSIHHLVKLSGQFGTDPGSLPGVDQIEIENISCLVVTTLATMAHEVAQGLLGSAEVRERDAFKIRQS